MLNNVNLLCRISQNFELRTSKTGTSYIQLNVAWNTWDKALGQNKSNFIRVTIFGKQAEFIGKNAYKGALLAIQGELEMVQYNDKNGNKITTYEILAQGVDLLSHPSQKPTDTPVAEANIIDATDDDLPF